MNASAWLCGGREPDVRRPVGEGQLLATFALFDLVGLKLSPRIAKIADKPRWRPHPPSHYARWPRAGPLLAERAQTDVIEEQWDKLCRVAGSLKLGYVSASLLVARLQASARQHPLAKALPSAWPRRSASSWTGFAAATTSTAIPAASA